jgi:hypothetical protein
MKNHVSMIAAAVVAGLLIVLAAQGQTSSTPHLTATIPFEFSAGERVWPAGEYTVSFLNATSSNRVLRLTRKDGRSLVIQTHDVIGNVRDEGRLVFRRYGEKYFLSQAWLPADNTGLDIAKSRAEKVMKQQLAAEKVRTTTIALNSTRK